MQLTDEQAKAVVSWIENGDGLSDVQKRLREEFDISMTYMDVRFLVDDLGATLTDAPEPVVEAPATDSLQDTSEPAALGGVQVELDRLNRPGAVVSGSVVFSDGVRAAWELDSSGRLGIRADQEGYKPPDQDIQEFQKKLGEMLQQRGF